MSFSNPPCQSQMSASSSASNKTTQLLIVSTKSTHPFRTSFFPLRNPNSRSLPSWQPSPFHLLFGLGTCNCTQLLKKSCPTVICTEYGRTDGTDGTVLISYSGPSDVYPSVRIPSAGWLLLLRYTLERTRRGWIISRTIPNLPKTAQHAHRHSRLLLWSDRPDCWRCALCR